MIYLLDTDICSYAMKRRHPHLEARLIEFEPGELQISVVSVFELHTGAQKLDDNDRILSIIDSFLGLVKVLDFNSPAAKSAAAVRARLERSGRPIGAIDMLIAGHALSIGATLVTNNTRDFERVRGLRLENWAQTPEPD